jgi:hypothetical protein
MGRELTKRYYPNRKRENRRRKRRRKKNRGRSMNPKKRNQKTPQWGQKHKKKLTILY